MWLIWRSPKTRRRFNVGTLLFDEKYEFFYTNHELKEAIENGFEYFPGFEDLTKTYESYSLFVNIETRLPNKKRPDYEDILSLYGLNKNSTSMEILNKTKGRLLTDNYEFVPSFDPHYIEFELAGTSHCDDVLKYKDKLTVTRKLKLELDPNNPFDSYSIKAIVSDENRDYHLGYVPRYYSKQLTQILQKQKKYEAIIQSLNFESSLSDENITVQVKIDFDEEKGEIDEN